MTCLQMLRQVITLHLLRRRFVFVDLQFQQLFVKLLLISDL